MSQYEKALARLLSRPKDFTWRELQAIMNHLGYVEKKGSGSGRKFVSRSNLRALTLHEPHPVKILKPYAVRTVVNFLKQNGYL